MVIHNGMLYLTDAGKDLHLWGSNLDAVGVTSMMEALTSEPAVKRALCQRQYMSKPNSIVPRKAATRCDNV